MKGSTLQELLKLNQEILIQQQLKISTLLAVLQEVTEYSRKNYDLKLGNILEKGLKKLSAFDEPTKFATARMKALKVRIQEEDKDEENSNC